MTGLEREVLALSPEEAVPVLEEAGLRVELRPTGPPRRPESGGGRERVVRLQVRGKTGVVTTARETGPARTGLAE